MSSLAGQRILNDLDTINKRRPTFYKIADIGAGKGDSTLALHKAFPDAHILACDIWLSKFSGEPNLHLDIFNENIRGKSHYLGNKVTPIRAPGEFLARCQPPKSFDLVYIDLWDTHCRDSNFEKCRDYFVIINAWLPVFYWFMLIANTSQVMKDFFSNHQGLEIARETEDALLIKRKGLFA